MQSTVEQHVDAVKCSSSSVLTRDQMQQHIVSLQTQLTQFKEEVKNKNAALKIQNARIESLEESLRLAVHKRFGASSEKILNNDTQDKLFDEAELWHCVNPDATACDLSDDELEDQSQIEVASHKRTRRSRKLSKDLPRQKIYLALSEEEKAGAIDTFYTLIKEELDIVPAKAQVLAYYQEKAVFKDDQGKRSLIGAQRPAHPLGKCIASTNLLAHIAVNKYADGLPLYRQVPMLMRYGAQIDRTTLANWMIRLGRECMPVVNLLLDHLMRCNYIQGDETRIKVLKEAGMEPTGHKFMWVLRGGDEQGRHAVAFSYDRSRGKAVAQRLLESFEGEYFQSDGYTGYNEICARKSVVHLGCWDHARRKFVDAIKAQPKAKMSGRPSKAVQAKNRIDKLYRIEREIKLLDSDEKYELRQKRSKAVLEELRQWLEDQQPKIAKDALTRKAIDYTLNQWDHLIRYCEHGQLNISNVLAENAIRPFAVGRKAWLFADTPRGAHANAVFYTLIETAKANGLDPYEYLQRVIAGIANADTVEKMEALLPWNTS